VVKIFWIYLLQSVSVSETVSSREAEHKPESWSLEAATPTHMWLSVLGGLLDTAGDHGTVEMTRMQRKQPEQTSPRVQLEGVTKHYFHGCHAQTIMLGRRLQDKVVLRDTDEPQPSCLPSVGVKGVMK